MLLYSNSITHSVSNGFEKHLESAGLFLIVVNYLFHIESF